MTRLKFSAGQGPSRPRVRPAVAIPAQFTASVMPPMNSFAACIAARTAASFDTSVWMNLARAPSDAALASPCSLLTSSNTA